MKVKINKKYTLIGMFAIILIVALLVLAYWSLFKSPAPTSEGINYKPSTKEDRQLNEQIKEDLSKTPGSSQDDSQSDDSSSVAKRAVVPIISAWGQPNGPGTDFAANGYIPGIVENDGMCTLTLTMSNITATVSKKSLENAQSTSCGQIAIPYNQLSRGEWNATLSYDSASSKGTSVITKVEIK